MGSAGDLGHREPLVHVEVAQRDCAEHWAGRICTLQQRRRCDDSADESMCPFANTLAGDPLALAAFMAEVQRVVGADGAPALPRRLPVGAEVIPAGGVHFRVWAPIATGVEVVLEGAPGRPIGSRSRPRATGTSRARPRTPAPARCYRYRLDGGRRCCPIPRRGSSPPDRTGRPAWSIPALFAWTDDAWSGRRLAEQVLYELHVGTFTPEGTWAAATRELARPGRARGDDARGHAGGRVPRRLRLGLRRRGLLRADPSLRRARRLPALRRSARIAPGSA